MRGHWTLLLVGGAAIATAPALAEPRVQALDLAQAVALARQHSPNLKDRDDDLASAQHRLQQAKARGLPRLTVSMRYSRVNHVDPAQIAVASPIPGMPAPPPVQLGEAVDNQAAMRLSVDQPLFVGHAISAAKEASAYQGEAARERKRQEQADLDLRVEEAYVAVIHTGQHLDVAERSERLLHDLHRDALRREEIGVGTAVESARSAARHTAAKAGLVQAQANLELASMNMATLLGLDLDTAFRLADLPAPGDDLPAEEALQQQAAVRRPELAVARAQSAAQQAQARGEASALYPQVWLRGGVSYDQPNQRYFPPRSQFDPSWDLSAVVSWNWDWGAARHASSAAALQANVAARQVARIGEGVRLDVARARKGVTTARARMAATESAVAAADVALRRARELCDAGRATFTQVLDAERDLSQALADRAQARSEVRLSYSRLRRAIGG